MRRSEGGARQNSARPTRPAILGEVPTPGDMGCLLFLLLWALLQAWGSAEGGWNEGDWMRSREGGERELARTEGTT